MQAWMDWGKQDSAQIIDQGGLLVKTKRVAPERLGGRCPIFIDGTHFARSMSKWSTSERPTS
jgi:hypothetical protein